MKRVIGVLAVVLALAGTSCKPNDDPVVLRRAITRSAEQPRLYTIRVASNESAYVVKAKLEDDLRYSMLLESATGKPLVDYIVGDDALAVRLRDQSFGTKLANVLGDPVVDKTLRTGQWVQDPSGAPPVVQASTAAGQTSGNPFQDARQVLLFAQSAMGQGSQVVKWSLEDISYKSRFDPWRYPKGNENRYDVRPPPLPRSEAQTVQARGGDIGPQHFRKLSVFTEKGKVDQICEAIDIFGHEDYVAIKERGNNWNPFLTALFDRVLKGDTATPVRQRYMVVDLSYSEGEAVSVPAGAKPGKLTVFVSALQQAITAGALKPASAVDTSECRRAPGEEGSRQ